MEISDMTNEQLVATTQAIYVEQRRRAEAEKDKWGELVGTFVTDGSDILHFVGVDRKFERDYLVTDRVSCSDSQYARLDARTYTDVAHYIYGGGSDRWKRSDSKAFLAALDGVEEIAKRIRNRVSKEE